MLNGRGFIPGREDFALGYQVQTNSRTHPFPYLIESGDNAAGT